MSVGSNFKLRFAVVVVENVSTLLLNALFKGGFSTTLNKATLGKLARNYIQNLLTFEFAYAAAVTFAFVKLLIKVCNLLTALL